MIVVMVVVEGGFVLDVLGDIDGEFDVVVVESVGGSGVIDWSVIVVVENVV